MLEDLESKVGKSGKPQWRPMLSYVAELHKRSTHEPRYPFEYPWEEIGSGYCYGPAFGHWDIVHQIMDTMPYEPLHAKNQVLNNLVAQQPDGFVPGAIYMVGGSPKWSLNRGHPSLWQVAVQDYSDMFGTGELIETCYEPLVRLIHWYEANRRAEENGFYYVDILNNVWESGVDEGIRFRNVVTRPYACVDATAHVYWLYEHAAKWAESLGKEASYFRGNAAKLRQFIRDNLFDQETGFFHDIWTLGRPKIRHMAFEGMWPMVVRAATYEQAMRVIDDNLLNESVFFSTHPIATVGLKDPAFELRCWRGPAWNSMTYWASRGCIDYERKDAARILLERALDASAVQFEKTGTIWEFYHPYGGNPLELQRKPHRKENVPCRDYLGHNPLIAMARLWELTR